MQTLKSISEVMRTKSLTKGKSIIFFISTLISTCCFVGKIKYASGTFGSILAIFLCIPFVNLSLTLQIIILTCLLVFGSLSTHFYLIKLNDLTKDPKEVVIDEIFAVFMITFLSQIITNTFEWHHFLSIFVLFRFFDIIKPYPISYIDKNIHGATGIMLDDILAGVASFLVYILAYVK